MIERGHRVTRQRAPRTEAEARPTLTLLGLTLILFGCALALPAGAIASSPAGWLMQRSGTDNQLNSVDFLNSNQGWAVGDGGDIIATTNGGATWKAQHSSLGNDAVLWSVHFVDASDGWAVGWNNDNNGTAIGSIILATTNGGGAWKAQDASVAGVGSSLTSVSFVNASDGWAVGSYDNGTTSGPVILATTNGGTTWNAQDASVAAGSQLTSATFVDASDGWAVGNPGIYATTNGGTTWMAQDTTDYLNSVSFVNASDGWAASGSGIFATTNGGATWKVQDPGLANYLSAITFANASDGWAVGAGAQAGGCILATTDGGATWSVRNIALGGFGYGNQLDGVTFADATHGWAVGNGGVVIATTNGGLVKPTLTLSLTSGAVRLGKSLTAKGKVAPIGLSGKVALTVQRRHGGSWRTVAGASRTIRINGAYGWSYKPTKRGLYRMRTTIAKTATNMASATTWRAFRVI